MSAQIDRDKIVEDLGQVFDFLHSIDDPYADSVAMAAGLISGEIGEAPAAARLLTLEEVRGWKGFVWLELAGEFEVIADSKNMTRAVVDDFSAGAVYLYLHPGGAGVRCEAIMYSETWRCWADPPTEEDRAGTPW